MRDSGGYDGALRIWDLTDGSPIGEPLLGHETTVEAVAVTEIEGDPVAVSGSEDLTVRVWNLATGKAVWDVADGTPASEPLTAAEIDPSSSLEAFLYTEQIRALATGMLEGRPIAAAGGRIGAIHIWDLSTRQVLHEPLTGHKRAVEAIALGELDDRLIAVSGSADGTIRLWDLLTGKAMGNPLVGDGISKAGAALPRHIESAVVTFETGGTLMALVGGDAGKVWLWDTSKNAPVHEYETGHQGAVTAIALTAIRSRVVVLSGGVDGSIRLWDLVDGTLVATPLPGHVATVTAVASAEIGGRVIAVSGDQGGTVRLWDLETLAPIGEPRSGHDGKVLLVQIGELAGRAVAVSGGEDANVRMWDLSDGTPIGEPLRDRMDEIMSARVTEPPRDNSAIRGVERYSVRALAVGEAGGRSIVLSGGDDGALRLWDLAQAAAVGGPLASHDGSIRAVALHKINDRPIAIYGAGRAIHLWDLVDARPVSQPLTGHQATVTALAATEVDGRAVIISGSFDRTLRVWEATGRCLACIELGEVSGVAIAPDRTVVAGGAFGVARLNVSPAVSKR